MTPAELEAVLRLIAARDTSPDVTRDFVKAELLSLRLWIIGTGFTVASLILGALGALQVWGGN